ncbi:type III-D CRISPR-associated protein Csx19 [Gordonia bronchialis]|uniref:type III-D CRISPR-associated protein Csx19 n=1 Tax=Gordonia bronchialis TaxID=2054 RepID=UPI002270CF8D|nr:CRISPR-associated protein Csx19 [Gordonia bronchialis]
MSHSSRYLSSVASQDLSASQATALLGAGQAIGFIYSAVAAQFIVRRNDAWFAVPNYTTADSIGTMSDEVLVDFAGVYELCVFTSTDEVRWVQTLGGRGTAYARSEGVTGPGPRAFGEPREHLLWGQVIQQNGSPSGWVATASARIGTVYVPLADDVAIGDRVAIRAQEYSDEDDQGNVYVADSRYIAVVRQAGAPTPKKAGSHG